MTNKNIPSDMDFKFFKEGANNVPALLVHVKAVMLNASAYRLIGKPPDLKIGISDAERVIYVWPVNDKGDDDAIYLSDYCMSVEKAMISTKCNVRDTLVRMGLEKNNHGTYDGEKLIFKF